MKTVNYTCISCPIGCAMTLTDDNGVLTVAGNSCQRGVSYAQEEYTAPKRVITATIATSSHDLPRVPIKTAKPLPKELVPALLAELKKCCVDLPVAMGQTVLTNFQNSGVDVVITRTVK